MTSHQLHGPIGAAKDGIKFGIVNQRKENLSEKQRSLCQLPEHEVKLLNQLTKEIEWQEEMAGQSV
jgi:hypothetical protein